MSVSSGYTRESSPFSDVGTTASAASSPISRHGLKLEIASSGFGSSGSLHVLSSPEPITPPPNTRNKKRTSKNQKAANQIIQRKKIPDMKSGPLPSTVTFTVRESLYGRKGWIVMPAATSAPADMRQVHPKDLEKIYDQLNSMELAGQQVPETITVDLNHR